MKIVIAFACALSINVASAELVVYEGTADVRSVFDPYSVLWYSVAVGDEFRFRVVVDNSTPAQIPVGEEPSSFYPGAVRDFAVWINDAPISFADFELRSSNISVLDNQPNYVGGPQFDTFGIGWSAGLVGGTVGGALHFGFGVQDYDAIMLTSKAFPAAVDLSLADMTSLYFDFFTGRRFQQEAHPGLDLTTFTISSVSSLLARLRTASEGVGPGKSLANKVILAQTYYAVPDLVSTCAVLAEYVTQTAHKKVPAAQGAALADDARLISSAIGCE